ncbi:MAG: exosortase H-associated membrane protein [Acidobacteriota bacterium]
MPRIDWRLALKGLAGFLVGLAIWAFLSPLYDRFVAASAETTLRLFENPSVTRLRPAEDNFVTVDRSDFDPRSKRPAISIRDLTFNIVLLVALFAASKRVFSDRNMAGFAGAAALLVLTHIFGTVVEVMSIYVAKLGMWSTVNYTPFDRNLWGVLNHFYRLVFMYAIAFALWWVFRDPGTQAVPASAAAARKKRKR